MAKYLEKIRELAVKFEYFEVVIVSRDESTRQDALARIGTSSMQDVERTVLLEILVQKSIDTSEVYMHN